VACQDEQMPDVATQVAPRKLYSPELRRLQVELVKLQGWVRATGVRVVVVLEGRDA
jgi:polyphosphate kinase 2 (PPK2 family)